MTEAQHVAMILDGNRRWAASRGLLPVEGHHEGYLVAKRAVEWAIESKLASLTLFAFSTENWNRDEREVAALMALVTEALTKDLEEYISQGVRVVIAGDRARFDAPLQEAILCVERETQACSTLTLYVALSYSGRSDILHAVNRAEAQGGHAMSAEELSKLLWIPVEPDIVIRTGGERRLSNFLLWQAAYSELFFVDTLWPDFTKEEFMTILKDFSSRQRRFGR